MQGIGQTKGVRQFVGQGQGFVAPFEGLLRIAKMPQVQGRNAETLYPRVNRPIEESQSVVLLRVVESNRLLQVGSARGELP